MKVKNDNTLFDRILKRLFDICLAGLGLLLFPVLIPVMIMIRADGGPVFFLQKRVGLHGKTFHIFKFRTMRQGSEKKGLQITSSGDPRITDVGRFLRKTKIDEFPQLLNVLWGEMSIVGPRPEVPYYVNKWTDRDRQLILAVKPGITDQASIQYSKEEEILAKYEDYESAYINKVMPHKLKLYRKYVKERNLSTDIKIILLTLKKVIGGSV